MSPLVFYSIIPKCDSTNIFIISYFSRFVKRFLKISCVRCTTSPFLTKLYRIFLTVCQLHFPKQYGIMESQRRKDQCTGKKENQKIRSISLKEKSLKRSYHK